MVHLYNLITDEELYIIVNRELEDIHIFMRQVMSYLDSLPE